MTPAAIIQQATADGVSLALSPVGTIKATGARGAVTRWLPLIQEHKPGILATLKEEVTSGLEALEERAAIIEFDGGLPRAEAEVLAWEQVQALMQRLNALEWLARYSPERLPEGYRPEQFPVAKLQPGPQFWEERERRGRSA
jgi:hypothetical protein